MATKRQRRKRRRRAGASNGAKSEEGAEGRSREADIPAISQPRSAGREAAPAARRPSRTGPPPPPWGSFPLSELVVLIALILLVAGFFVPPPRGAVMLGAGLVLGSLAGLEVAVREHFAGYRSHTLLLAGAVGIGIVLALTFLGPESLAVGLAMACGLVAFAAAAWLLARAFRRRSGGALFRVRGE